MGMSLVRTGFVFFVNNNETTLHECIVSSVLQGLTESLASWGTVLMGLFALALHSPLGKLHEAVVSRTRYQALLIALTWVLVLGEFGMSYALTDRYTKEGCVDVKPTPRLIHGVFDMVSLALLVVMLVLYALQVKRKRSAVGPEDATVKRLSTLLLSHLSQDEHVAETLVILCVLTLFLHFPAACVDLTHAVEQHPWDDVHIINFCVYLLTDFSNLLLLVVLFARHADLRAVFKRVFCRKCFLYDETFTREITSTYDHVRSCQEKLRNPSVARDFLDDPNKNKTLDNMPALKESAVTATTIGLLYYKPFGGSNPHASQSVEDHLRRIESGDDLDSK